MTGYDSEDLIGSDPAVSRVRAAIEQLASSDSSVLITGETGTGKEVVAKLIHCNSPRARRAMVCLNCAALSDSLLESELFGYERGAFTGASTLTIGKLESANGGTLFLDEIGEMGVLAQAKLLRAVDSKEIYRLGGQRAVHLNVRVLAATNRNVDELVRTGGFRSDFYYRINVGRIHLPPLRERRGDIPELAEYLVKDLSIRLGCHAPTISDEVREALVTYAWLGNIRELRNVLECSLLSRPSQFIEFGHLPDSFRGCMQRREQSPNLEHDRILSALEETHWNKTRASEILNWSRSKFYRKLREYQIE